MEVSGEHHAPVALLPGMSRGTHLIGRCVGPRTGLDVTEKRKVSFPRRHSTHGSSSQLYIVAVPTTLSRFPKIVVIYLIIVIIIVVVMDYYISSSWIFGRNLINTCWRFSIFSIWHKIAFSSTSGSTVCISAWLTPGSFVFSSWHKLVF